VSFGDSSAAEVKPGGRYRVAKLLAVFLIAPVLLSVLLVAASDVLLDLIERVFSGDGVRAFILGGLYVSTCVSWLAGPLAYAVNGGGYRLRHKPFCYALFGGSIGLAVSVIVVLLFGVGNLTVPFALVAIGQGIVYALWLWICLALVGLFGLRSTTKNV
jgi:hypothetical protein